MPANSKPEINLWQSAEIKLALQDQIISFGKIDLPVNQVVIDSRSKTDNGLFVAFKGEFNDGHNYLQNAFENGCKLAIVDRIPEKFKNDKRLILVKNSLDALDSLAIFARNRTKAKIIAVTGSVGKTSVKEMLKIIFKTQGRTFGTIGNLNNNFGLPLSLCNMPQDCKFGIFEIGMSHFGEIEKLSKIARPHIAIITNVMAAHIGNFKNEEEIALAKSEIFAGLEENGFALINADNIHNEFIRKQALSRKILTKNIVSFSANEASNIKIIGIHDSGNFHSTVEVLLSSSNKKISYQINSINQATIFNSLIAVGCLELIGTNSSDGLEALKTLKTPKGRGNLINVEKNGIKFTIIDDSYNANSASMKAGLKFLSDLKKYKPNSRTIAFVGEMLELGEFNESEHKAIANYISNFNIDLVLLVGSSMQNLVSEIKPEKLIGSFPNSNFAAENIKFEPQDGDIIFAKGSRGTKMEKLIEKLL